MKMRQQRDVNELGKVARGHDHQHFILIILIDFKEEEEKASVISKKFENKQTTLSKNQQKNN